MTLPMTQDVQTRLMKRVVNNTPGGGGSGMLRLLEEAVRTDAPNSEANEKVTYCAESLEHLSELALAAAALLRDPDFIAANADVFIEKEDTQND